MTDFQLLLVTPMFAMVLLTFIVLVTLGSKRFSAAKRKTVDVHYYKLYQGDGEPAQIRQISRNFSNLFEVPVLFYAGILLALVLKVEMLPLVYISWGYVLARYAHSYVHCTSNKVRLRFRIFLLSCFLLMCFWGTLFFSLVI